MSPSTKPKPSVRSKPILPPDANKETVDYAVSKTVVANYVKTLLRRWLPWKDIWGSRHNHHRIMRHIDSFIHIGRHESITVAQVMQGIRTADIPWLKSGVTRAIQQKCASRFVTWLFNRVIAVILAQTFYVTEAEGHGTEIFYFQKHIWRHIVHRHLHEFADRFVAIDPFATGATDDDTTVGPTTSSTAFELQRSVSAPSATSSSSSSSSSNIATHIVRVQSDHPPGAPTAARAMPPATTKKTSTLLNAAIRTAAKTATPSSSAAATTLPSVAQSASAVVSSGKQPSHQEQQRAESNTVYQNQRVCQLQSWSLKVAENSLLARSMTVGQWQEHQRLQKAWLMTKAKQFSTIRFVPKKKALRGITNLRAKPGTTPYLPKFPLANHSTNAHGTTTSNAINAPLVVTNTMLYNCLHVLKHLYDNDQRLRGFGVFGMDDVYREYRSYWNRLADIYGANAVRNGEIPLYMAALDLEKCYDNIDPIRLYDLIHDLLVGNPTTAAPTTTTTAVPASPEALKTFQGRAGSSSSSSSSSHAMAGFPSNSNFSSKFSDAIGPGGSSGSDRKGEASSSTGRLQHPVLIHKYAVTHTMRSMERVVTKHLKCCALSGDTIPFEDAGPEIARQYRNCVVADAVMYSRVTAQEILRILRHHLFAQVVRMPSPLLDPQRQSPYCMQVKGIPQGSILSPVLCHLYFGHVENTLFETAPDESKRPSLGWWKLAEPSKAVPQTMVMRLMDDYLIISTQQSCVEHFLQTAFDGYGEYGGKINPVKTKVNFSTSLRVAGGTEIIALTPPWMAAPVPVPVPVPATVTATTAAAFTTTEAKTRQKHAMDQEMHDSLESLATQAQRAHSATMFTWCGLLVDTSTMELRPDLQRLLSRSLASSVSIEANHPGMAFRRAIKSFFRMKCHALVLDTDMNSETTVLDSVVNLYQLTAARSLAYYQRLHRTYRVLLTPVYVLRCIREGILFAARLIPTRMRRKIIRKVTLEGLSVPDLDDHDADDHEDDDGSAAMDSDAGIHDGVGRDASRRSSPVTATTDVMVTHFGNCSISVKMVSFA